MNDFPEEQRLMKKLKKGSFGLDLSIYFLIIFLVVLATTLFVS